MANILTRIKNKWQLIVYMTLVLGAVAFFVSTLIPPKYRSDITVLFVAKSVDTFSASRSAEYLGAVFSQVVYTDSFMSDVLESPQNIEKRFSLDPKKRKKQWENGVMINKIDNTGILEISVFDTERAEAQKIAEGIGWNFVNNSKKYHGSEGSVEAKVINGPITTTKPAQPNVFVNAILGALIGLVGSLLLVFFFKDFDLKLFASQPAPSGIVQKQIEEELKKRTEKKELAYQDAKKEGYNFEMAQSVQAKEKVVAAEEKKE